MQQSPHYLPNAAATHQVGICLGQRLPAGLTVLLQGELGAGKTTFIQGVGQGLGITDPIVSPTFTLLCEYLAGRMPLYHFDLYRLEPEAVVSLNLEGYWDATEVDPGLVAIEWPERLPYRPNQYLELQLSLAAEPEAGRWLSWQAVNCAQLELDLQQCLGLAPEF
ncbi:MAG: tRNA (adenosine(37)-N6)-threonylcarbamoyltransferase complex ATPase subunit type 1 TsaE [Cyanobacteria bacterium P01_H01_bin.121]